MRTELIVFIGLTLLSSFSYAADISGVWRTVDDKTGVIRGHVQITQEANGTYTGTIIEDFPAIGEVPLVKCTKCPAPYTNKPVIGLEILKGFKEDENNPNSFSHGKALDPRSGKIYSGKAKLSNDGRRLRLRGYIGVSMLGRSQTWLRKE